MDGTVVGGAKCGALACDAGHLAPALRRRLSCLGSRAGPARDGGASCLLLPGGYRQIGSSDRPESRHGAGMEGLVVAVFQKIQTAQVRPGCQPRCFSFLFSFLQLMTHEYLV